MAIGRGSMERASKAVKNPNNEKSEAKTEPIKAVVTADANKDSIKAEPEKKTVKKPVAKKPSVKKVPEKTVVVPTKQVMDMVIKDRIEVGDEMPIYFY